MTDSENDDDNLEEAIYFVQNDMTHKSYDRIKPDLDKAKKEEVDDAKEKGLIEGEAKGFYRGLVDGEIVGIDKRNIEIVKEMLKENYDIKSIIKLTKLSEKEISKIKKDMGL